MSMDTAITLTAQGWLAAAEMKIQQTRREADADMATALALQAVIDHVKT
jgi:hypothetical protein